MCCFFHSSKWSWVIRTEFKERNLQEMDFRSVRHLLSFHFCLFSYNHKLRNHNYSWQSFLHRSLNMGFRPLSSEWSLLHLIKQPLGYIIREEWWDPHGVWTKAGVLITTPPCSLIHFRPEKWWLGWWNNLNNLLFKVTAFFKCVLERL